VEILVDCVEIAGVSDDLVWSPWAKGQVLSGPSRARDLVPKVEDETPIWVARDHRAVNEMRIVRFIDAVGNVNEKYPHLDNALSVGDIPDCRFFTCSYSENQTSPRSAKRATSGDILEDPYDNPGCALPGRHSPHP